MERNRWKMRYAPHIGFPGRDCPWFRHTLAGIDPVVHINHIASLGFAGVADKDLLLRPASEQSAIGEALANHGLEAGAFVDQPGPPYLPWASRDKGDVAVLEAAMSRCLEAARRVGGGIVCVVAADQPDLETQIQLRNFSENLRWASEKAQAAGVSLALEPVSRARVPGALVRTMKQAVKVVGDADAPVGLICDSLHGELESGNAACAFEQGGDRIVLVQLADTDRLEPGSGAIDLAGFLRSVRASGFTGLIELEHAHSQPGVEGEQASLARLEAIDAML